jgi:hypothetical protein
LMRLVVTTSTDTTADYLIGRLKSVGIDFVRLDTDSVSTTCLFLQEGTQTLLLVGGQGIRPHDVTHVWLRRPEKLTVEVSDDPGENDHARLEWTFAFEGFLAQIPKARWFNHPSANAGASSKLEQIGRAVRHGLLVPDTLVTQDPAAFRRFVERHQGRVVAKPISRGYIERDGGVPDSQVFTSPVTPEALLNVEHVRTCPTLLQERISKRLDVRVTVVDGQLKAVGMEHLTEGQQILDIRRDSMRNVHYTNALVPPDVAARTLKLVASYDLRFAAVDFAVDQHGRWVFFEINPNGQWAWLDLVAGMEVYRLFESAFKRVGGPKSKKRLEFSLADWVTYVGVKGALIQVSAEDVRRRSYVEDVEAEPAAPEGRATSDVLSFAKEQWATERDDRSSIDNKMKWLTNVIFLAWPSTIALINEFDTSWWTLAPGLAVLALATAMAISYHRLEVIVQPRLSESEMSEPEDVVRRTIVNSYFLSTRRNAAATRFVADLFRASLRLFVVAALLLLAAVGLHRVLA